MTTTELKEILAAAYRQGLIANYSVSWADGHTGKEIIVLETKEKLNG